MYLAEGEDGPLILFFRPSRAGSGKRALVPAGFGRGQLRGRKEISFPIALVGCHEESSGGNGEKLRCLLHLGGPYLLFTRAFPLRAPTSTCPAARKRCPLFSVASTVPMSTTGKALFSWRVLVADDHEERRHLPRHSRRLPGSRSQIFIERGEPTFGRAGPSFLQSFCFYMLLIPLSRTPLWGGNALSSSLCRQRVNTLIPAGFGCGQSRGREVSYPSHPPQRPVRRRGILLAEMGGKPPRPLHF